MEILNKYIFKIQKKNLHNIVWFFFVFDNIFFKFIQNFINHKYPFIKKLKYYM